MSSYITDAIKAQYETVMQNMHDTFARPVLAYKDSRKVVISTNADYNYLYNNVRGDATKSIKNQVQFQTFEARILYEDKQREELVDGAANSSMKVQRPVGEVRMKVDKTGYDYIKDSKRIEIDGALFYKATDVRRHGLFSPKFFTYYLRPTEETDA